MCSVTSEQPKGFSPLVSGPAFPTHIQRDATSALVSLKGRGWDFRQLCFCPSQPLRVPVSFLRLLTLPFRLQVCLRVSCIIGSLRNESLR